MGGKDSFPADREAAEQALKAFPNGRTAVRANRAFLHRVIRYLAAEAGIWQFLDLTRPVALSLIAIPHFIPDAEQKACPGRTRRFHTSRRCAEGDGRLGG